MIRDIKEYYQQVTKDYNNMKQELEEMSKELESEMIQPEQLENMERIIQPIKMNFETLSYFMYLLNKPAKKSKQKRYESQNKKLLNNAGDRTKEKVLEENKQALQELNKFREEEL